jgi:DNA repair protein RadC
MSQSNLFPWPQKPQRKQKSAREWKIVSLRETASDELPCCVRPDDAVQYWRKHIATAPHFNPDCECFAVLMLNVRQRIRGHHLVSIGSLTEAMAHPREVFRAAVIGAAHSVVLMHNHPSGDPTPSDADLRMTKRLVESGRILCIEVADHIVVGSKRHLSLREAGIL